METFELTPERLKEVAFLESFSDEELKTLIGLGTVHEYEAHSNIVIEGEDSWGIYVILSGSTSIIKANKVSGNCYEVGELRTGGIFGEMSIIDSAPRSATVKATSPCKVFYLSKETFENFLGESTERLTRFYQKCLKILVERLRDLGDSYVISQYQLWKTAIQKQKEAA